MRGGIDPPTGQKVEPREPWCVIPLLALFALPAAHAREALSAPAPRNNDVSVAP